MVWGKNKLKTLETRLKSPSKCQKVPFSPIFLLFYCVFYDTQNEAFLPPNI